jgi:uncharacterized protein DUF2764
MRTTVGILLGETRQAWGIMRSNSYYMLISSLPALPTRFEVDRLPITLERLQTRLRMLEPEDAEEISRMLDVLKWSSQFTEARDTAVARRYSELMQGIANPLVREVLTASLDMRMIVAALRRRRQGEGPPTIGIGQWLEHIRRHFNRPDFALGHVYSWLVPFDQLLERGDVLALYRRLLGQAWAYMTKRMQDYDTFSFEAVVLYVARWDIIRRWQQLQPERGRTVFEALVTEAMGEHAELYR